MPSTGRRVVAPEPKTKKKSGLLECYHQFATSLPKGARLPALMLGIRFRTMRRTTGAQSAATDQITDVGADAQFQLVMSTH